MGARTETGAVDTVGNTQLIECVFASIQNTDTVFNGSTLYRYLLRIGCRDDDIQGMIASTIILLADYPNDDEYEKRAKGEFAKYPILEQQIGLSNNLVLALLSKHVRNCLLQKEPDSL